MKRIHKNSAAALRVCSLMVAFTLVGTSPGNAQSPESASDAFDQIAKASPWDAYATAVQYVVQFYPLWFTYNQTQVSDQVGATNRLVAPAQVTPLFKFVVASNYDTLYSSAYLDLSQQPVIVTVPPANVGYSSLILDPFGAELPAAIPSKTPGVFALTGPGFSGMLPPNATQIPISVNFPLLTFRVVKFSPDGQDETAAATLFRDSIKLQTLTGYLIDPSQGATIIAPESLFSTSFKLLADGAIANEPITFLKQLQTAVKSPITPTLSAEEKDLSDRFDALFSNGDSYQSEMSAGAKTAHELIVRNYQTHTGPTNWIHFTNIADWGPAVIDRASISEYLQQSNSIATAAYYHTFRSGDGHSLDGCNGDGYVLTFPAGQLPDAELFWSLTAYTPDAIELVPNPADKYLVGSYTPGLTYNPDGSLTIYMTTEPPEDVPLANWLPIPSGKFNIVLRVYGPAGSVADNTYVPPAINLK